MGGGYILIMQKTTRVLIDISGSVIQSIEADGPAEVVIMDDAADVDMDREYDRKRVREVRDYNWYFWNTSVAIVDPTVIDPFFKAAKEVEETP